MDALPARTLGGAGMAGSQKIAFSNNTPQKG
jgi:hypothetical protein